MRFNIKKERKCHEIRTKIKVVNGDVFGLVKKRSTWVKSCAFAGTKDRGWKDSSKENRKRVLCCVINLKKQVGKQ